MSEKKWLTLNQHGKDCLLAWVCAISASDIRTSQLDYLYRKGIVDYSLNNPMTRTEFAGHSLTDAGVETIKHYYPSLAHRF